MSTVKSLSRRSSHSGGSSGEVAKCQKPAVFWLTGLPGAGKTTLANLIHSELAGRGYRTIVLDGDHLRNGLNRDLGFSRAERAENVRRAAEVAKLFVDAGFLVFASFISPYREERRLARELMAAGQFIEIYVDAPLSVVEERDPKGLYSRARAGELRDLTGVDSRYECPESPEIHLFTDRETPEHSAATVFYFLQRNGYTSG